jgi:ribonuclease D
MPNLDLTNEQVIELFKQLPPDQKRQALAVLSVSLRKKRGKRWRALLRKTQSLPQFKRLTEADIAAEISAYRASKL